MLPELARVLKDDLPREMHNAWIISKPDLISAESKPIIDATPLTLEERLARMQGLEIFANTLRLAGIEGLGLVYGSTLYLPTGEPSQDLDSKLIIDPKHLSKTLSLLNKFQFSGVNFINSELQEQFKQGEIDAFRLRGIVPESKRQTPFDLELYNLNSLKAFLREEKYLVRMGLMSPETYAQLKPTITEHSLVILLDGRRVKYPLYRWQINRDDCFWLFDIKPVGNIVIDATEEGAVFGINSVQNTLMESFPFYCEGDQSTALITDINHMFGKFIFQFILQNEHYNQNELEITKQFCELFVRRPKFSRDYYQRIFTRVLGVVRGVRRINQVMQNDDLAFESRTEIGSGYHSKIYLHENTIHSDEKLVVKVFPKQDMLSESEAIQFTSAIQSYHEMVGEYITMPKIKSIQLAHINGGYKIVLKEELIGEKNLAEEIQEGLSVDNVKKIFRNLLHIISKIKNDSEEDLLTPMIELKPENLVRNNAGEIVFVDEFPPRLLEPWTRSLWPTYGNPTLEWRQHKAIVHGDLNNILRYLLISFTILRDDLDPQQFTEEIVKTFKWSDRERKHFIDLVSASNESISPRRKYQAMNRGSDFCNFFGLKLTT